MTARILNVQNLEYRQWGHGVVIPGDGIASARYEARIGSISGKLGAEKLGYNVTVLPPGKRAFPLHNHRVNEEMFFILEGEGELRLGRDRHAIRAGDVIACPSGGPETAHQITNTSERTELRYLAVSTNLSPEISEYPDSNKFAVWADYPVADDGTPTGFRFISRVGTSLSYWEGE